MPNLQQVAIIFYKAQLLSCCNQRLSFIQQVVLVHLRHRAVEQVGLLSICVYEVTQRRKGIQKKMGVYLLAYFQIGLHALVALFSEEKKPLASTQSYSCSPRYEPKLWGKETIKYERQRTRALPFFRVI